MRSSRTMGPLLPLLLPAAVAGQSDARGIPRQTELVDSRDAACALDPIPKTSSERGIRNWIKRMSGAIPPGPVRYLRPVCGRGLVGFFCCSCFFDCCCLLLLALSFLPPLSPMGALWPAPAE
jgi:hypothetical protein